ncbi:MAG: UspA domain protein [Myxococcales bacterium]|nr:UspA domain protein [Myxococcales bacterium]
MVVGIDLTEYSEIVLEHALDQAARHEAPELHFLYVKENKKRAAEEMKQRLSAIVFPALQTFNQYGTNWRARLHVRAGKPDQEIAMLAADVRADLIVIGQFGLHSSTEKYKTVPGRVLNAAPCPTLVVGMPQPMSDLDQCAFCAAVREDSDGERWFCDGHSEPRHAEHMVTPMTVWTGGSLMW